MNCIENKNEAEAAVGDNIGKVFPKFYSLWPVVIFSSDFH